MNISVFPFKQTFSSVFFGAAIFLLSLPSQAMTVQEVPNPRQTSGNWVTDSAEILKPETEAQLNQMINRLENKNGAEIAVVTVPDTKPAASPKAFATELFNYWHIGKKGRDNGVLFLISKGDRHVEIETGYGVEEILPDAKVGNIIDTEIIPRFKHSNYDEGTLAGTRLIVVTLEPSLDKELQTNPSPAPSKPIHIEKSITNNKQIDNLFEGIIVFLIVFSCPIVLLIYDKRLILQDFLHLLQGFITHKCLHQPIYLEPEGISRTEYSHKCFENTKVLRCTDCGQPLHQVEPLLVRERLTPSQQVAQVLGNANYSGWQCLNCSPKGIHIRAYEKTSDELIRCPNCNELTVVKYEPEIVYKPMFFMSGLLKTNYKCQSCSYTHEIRTETRSAVGFVGGDSFGGSDSGGGGSFGGGDSGGGGAGGSW